MFRVFANAFEIGQRDAVKAFHGQHFERRIFLMHPRSGGFRSQAALFQKILEVLNIPRFIQEIALFEHGLLDVGDNTRQGRAREARREKLKQLRLDV